MRVLNIGTYPPKQCGIATFSMDIRNSLTVNGITVDVLAISDENYQYAYGPEVVFNLRQQHKSDYIKAAAFINGSPAIDLVLLQHEYGIYGGQDGEYLLELIKLLHKPFVLITHTVLPRPSRKQKEVLYELCSRAAGIVCMTRHSARLLTDLYEAPAEVLSIICHGVPAFKRQDSSFLKQKYHLQDKTVISTFGLLGPGKGLELGIEAVALLKDKFPDIRYLILGQTHPMLRKLEGEKYRQMLVNLVQQRQVEEQVLFVNRFLTDEELGEYLYMSDIYLSPYPNKDQAVSGTMAFAIGCGRAIVSTSYAYASEMLSENRGLLAKEADPAELAQLIEQLILDQELKARLQKKASQLGQSWQWPNIGREYKQFFQQVISVNPMKNEGENTYAKL